MSKVQVFAIFAAVVLVVLLFFAPNKPPLKAKKSVLPEEKAKDTESKINLAISYVQEGKDPMKGILLFREIIENDPNNIKAHFYRQPRSGQGE